MKQAPLIKLNCAAIPTGFLESELFGHERGAFTGAISQKIGRMELADGATLFLDEVDEIPLELQPKLLRVLQDHEFERLGSNPTIKVDLATDRGHESGLGREYGQHEFRMDLFSRLSVFPIPRASLTRATGGHSPSRSLLRSQVCRAHGTPYRNHPQRDNEC